MITLFKRNQQGDTIMEVLICMAMLGFMLGTAFTLTNRNQLSARSSQERAEATRIAEKQLEYLRTYYAKNSIGNPITIDENFCFKSDGGGDDGQYVMNDRDPKSTGEDPESEYIDDCRASTNGYSYRINIWKAGTADAGSLGARPSASVITVRWDSLTKTEPEEVKVYYTIDQLSAGYYGSELGSGGGLGLTPACGDGIENDGDGFIDMLDVGCTSLTDSSEVDPTPSLASFPVNLALWANSYPTPHEYPDGANPANSQIGVSPHPLGGVIDVNLSGQSGARNLVISYQNEAGWGGPPNSSASSFIPDYKSYEIKYCVAPSRGACSTWTRAYLPVNMNNPNSALASSPLGVNISSGDHLYIAWINNHWTSINGIGLDPNLRINSVSSYTVVPTATYNNSRNGSDYVACSPATSFGDGLDGCIRSAPSVYAYRMFNSLNYTLPSISSGPINVEIRYRNRANATLTNVLPNGVYSLRLSGGSYQTGLLLPTIGANTGQRTYVGQIYVPSSIENLYFAWDNDYYNVGASIDHNVQIDSVRIYR